MRHAGGTVVGVYVLASTGTARARSHTPISHTHSRVHAGPFAHGRVSATHTPHHVSRAFGRWWVILDLPRRAPSECHTRELTASVIRIVIQQQCNPSLIRSIANQHRSLRTYTSSQQGVEGEELVRSERKRERQPQTSTKFEPTTERSRKTCLRYLKMVASRPCFGID